MSVQKCTILVTRIFNSSLRFQWHNQIGIYELHRYKTNHWSCDKRMLCFYFWIKFPFRLLSSFSVLFLLLQIQMQVAVTPFPQSRIALGKGRNRQFSVNVTEDFCAMTSEQTTLGNFYIRAFWTYLKRYTNIRKCPVKVIKKIFICVLC